MSGSKLCYCEGSDILKVFAESTRRINQGFENMRKKDTPPRPSKFLGFHSSRVPSNLPEQAKEHFKLKQITEITNSNTCKTLTCTTCGGII